MSTLPLLFSIIPEVIAIAVRQEKVLKDGKEEMKLPMFPENMIIHLE